MNVCTRCWDLNLDQKRPVMKSKKKEAKGMTYFHEERRCATHLLNYVAPILEFLDDELRR